MEVLFFFFLLHRLVFWHTFISVSHIMDIWISEFHLDFRVCYSKERPGFKIQAKYRHFY